MEGEKFEVISVRETSGRLVARSTVTGAAVLLLVGGIGGWWFVSQSQTSSCGALLKHERVERALGSRYRESLDCEDLGKALQAVSTGPGKDHTLAEATAMRNTLIAMSDIMPEGSEPRLTIDPALRSPVAESLADYAQDVAKILEARDQVYLSRNGPSDGSWKDETGVHMAVPVKTLVRVIRAVSDSSSAFGVLRKESVRAFSEEMKNLPPESSVKELRPPARKGASVLGTLQAIRVDVIRDSSVGEARADEKVSDDILDPDNEMSYHVYKWAKTRKMDPDDPTFKNLQFDLNEHQLSARRAAGAILGST